jgi:DNA polymerase-3 subunit alpha
MIISGSPITDHVPVCTAKDSSMVVTQFAMKPVESLGMLKIDFLGLKTLTSVQKCVEMIAHNTGRKIDAANLPLDDKATFDLLNQGKTLGVFQLESGGMQDLAKQLHIDSFEEIIAVGALYRPGPMDMIPSFCNRKHGREEIEIDHPLMKDILSETYGVMVYQEQVMQIASAMAGYSLGEGDVLRRAMGKKDKEEMERQRAKFTGGCVGLGINEATAEKVFEKIEKFASYGFNKSHAAAYAYLTYVTAYFKANYPKEWMGSLMTCDRDDTTKLSKFIQEARAMHIEILPPDINQAGLEFAAVPNGIRFAMSGIKGVGYAVVEEVLNERARRGPFASFYDFIQRADKTKTPKKAIELFIEAGSFDGGSWSRDAMRESVDAMYAASQRDQKESALGVLNLFSLIEDTEKPFLAPPPVLNPSSKMQLLHREKELLGFYLTGHPMDSYKEILRHLSCVPFTEFEALGESAVVRAAFIVEALQIKVSNKTQRKFAILTISDGLERFELPVWSELYEEKVSIIRENNLLYGIFSIDRKNGNINLSCKYLDELAGIDEAKIKTCDEAYDRLKAKSGSESKWREKKMIAAEKKTAESIGEIQAPIAVKMRIDADRCRLSEILAMKELFRAHPGSSPIEIHFHSGDKRLGTIHIDASWGVKADPIFQAKLQALMQQVGSD